MSRRIWLAALAALALAGQARAQSDFTQRTPETPSDRWFSYDFNQQGKVGNQGYRSTDSNLFIGLPAGFNLTGDFSWYRTDTTSGTPTFSFGGGKDWDQVSLSANYAITTLANDFQSNAVEVKGYI